MPMRSKVQDPGIVLIRVGVAALLFVHGVYRATTGGVAAFGEFLTSQGFPAGGLLAWGLTLFEIVGAPLLAFGIAASALALLFSLELVAGIVLVHRHAGWFVVGGGRNGVEYSVCLILALVACGLSERRERSRRSGSSAGSAEEPVRTATSARPGA